MNLAKNLKYLRLKNKLSQEEIAEMLGKKSYTTIQKWESGVSEPPMRVAKKLADFFNVGIDDLINIDFEQQSVTPAKKGVKIPVLGQVAAGVPIDAIEEVIDWEEIPKEMAARGEYFGLKIKGDSMAPDIKNKDVVIVRKQPDAENNEIVIVTINGNEGVCKKLRKSSEGITLISRNPAYEPMFFTPKEVTELPVAIVGKVIELRRSF